MKLDLHNHTLYSPDANMQPEHYLHLARQKGLGLAITDHNSISAWPRLKKANQKYKVPLVLGEEIKIYNEHHHSVGELLGLFLQDFVQPGYYADVLTDLQAQDALISIAHPFDPLRKNCKVIPEIIHRVHCLEAFNARMCWNAPNEKASAFAQKHFLGITAGSDAHFEFEFGHSFIEVDATDMEEVRKKILRGKVTSQGIISNPIAHVYTQARKFKFLSDDPWVEPKGDLNV